MHARMFHPFVFFNAKLALVNLSCSEHVHESITSIQAVTDRRRWGGGSLVAAGSFAKHTRALGADVIHV